MDALFAIVRQKVKQGLQAITAKVCRNNKENLVRIVAICALPTITPAELIWTRRKEEIHH